MQKVIIGGIIALGLVMILLATRQLNAPKLTVYQVCSASRTSDKVQQNTCADLQQFYNVEYLCTANNTSPSNDCWVEDK